MMHRAFVLALAGLVAVIAPAIGAEVPDRLSAEETRLADLVRRDKSDFTSLAQLADLLVRRGSHRKALTCYERLTARFPEAADHRFAMARCAAKLGERALAIASAGRVLANEPGHEAAVALLAQLGAPVPHVAVDDPATLARVLERSLCLRRQELIARGLSTYNLEKGTSVYLTAKNAREVVTDLAQFGFLPRPWTEPTGQGELRSRPRGAVWCTLHGGEQGIPARPGTEPVRAAASPAVSSSPSPAAPRAASRAAKPAASAAPSAASRTAAPIAPPPVTASAAPPRDPRSLAPAELPVISRARVAPALLDAALAPPGATAVVMLAQLAREKRDASRLPALVGGLKAVADPGDLELAVVDLAQLAADVPDARGKVPVSPDWLLASTDARVRERAVTLLVRLGHPPRLDAAAQLSALTRMDRGELSADELEALLKAGDPAARPALASRIAAMEVSELMATATPLARLKDRRVLVALAERLPTLSGPSDMARPAVTAALAEACGADAGEDATAWKALVERTFPR